LTSSPATAGDSRLEAVFHSHVPAQETTTPRKTTPATSLAGPGCAPDGVVSWPASAAAGSPASATAPVATPTAVDQPAGESARCPDPDHQQQVVHGVAGQGEGQRGAPVLP